jgi:hypothetical protein
VTAPNKARPGLAGNDFCATIRGAFGLSLLDRCSTLCLEMEHPQLVEYAKNQLAKGVSRAEIEAHLRGQNWAEGVIATVLAAAGPAPASRPPTTEAAAPAPAPGGPGHGRPRKLILLLLALAVLLGAWGAYQIYHHYAVAKLVREKTKFVEFTGNITGQFEAAGTDDFGLVTFQGLLDSSQIDSPKAALQLTFNADTDLPDNLRQIPPGTDAHLLSLTLLSIAGGAQTIGGGDIRFADWTTYLRPARTPLTGSSTAGAVAGLATALLGPNILSDFWVKVPARNGNEDAARTVLSTEQKATWALLFRPTEKIFGESKELRFLDKKAGDDIDGTPTEIHRYAIDGPWLTKQLVRSLRNAAVEDKLDLLATLQNLVLGGDSQQATASLDSLAISDGELDVWVGREDTLPRRMTLRLGLKEGSRAPLALRLRGEMDIRYRPAVLIEIPAQAIDLKQLEEQLGILQNLGNLFR